MKRVYIPDTLYDVSPFVKRYPQFRRLSDLPSDLQELLKRVM